MGVCASCLGLGGRGSHDSESSRLLDDDLYQSGYGYGTVNQGHRNGPSPEDLKREREALEAICQRTSDSVIDIWSVQPQTGARTGMLSQNHATASSSRTPSNGTTGPVTTDRPESCRSPPSPDQGQKHPKVQDVLRPAESPIPGELGGIRYLAYNDPQYPHNVNLSAVPRHWGEVVMTTRKGKKTRPGLDVEHGKGKANDVFGVLEVE